jgi:hypothetical protein
MENFNLPDNLAGGLSKLVLPEGYRSQTFFNALGCHAKAGSKGR